MLIKILLIILGIAVLVFLVFLWFGWRWTRAKKKAEEYVQQNQEKVLKEHLGRKLARKQIQKNKKFSVAPRYKKRKK